MTTPPATLIADAIDTIRILGWTFAGWIAVAALVGTIVILTIAATGVWAIGAVRRAFRRHRPDDYEEAA